MLDLETLDTKPGATVLSIGAVLFDRETALCCGNGMFYMEVNIASQLPFHTTVSADTMDFWARTDPEWIEEVMSDAYQAKLKPIGEVLDALDAWIQSHYLKEDFNLGTVWAQGQDFDFPILAELYDRVRDGKKNLETQSFLPWPFWRHRDTRTAYDVAGFDTGTVERTGKHHNALADCHRQIKCLWMALNNFCPQASDAVGDALEQKQRFAHQRTLPVQRRKPMTPRSVTYFPRRGNHLGDRIVLPSGQVYQWIAFKRWQRVYGQ